MSNQATNTFRPYSPTFMDGVPQRRARVTMKACAALVSVARAYGVHSLDASDVYEHVRTHTFTAPASYSMTLGHI